MGLRVATSNLFPQEVANILSNVFNIQSNGEIMKHFQDVIDMVGVGVREITDDSDPDLNPLEYNQESQHHILKAEGIRALASKQILKFPFP